MYPHVPHFYLITTIENIFFLRWSQKCHSSLKIGTIEVNRAGFPHFKFRIFIQVAPDDAVHIF